MKRSLFLMLCLCAVPGLLRFGGPALTSVDNALTLPPPTEKAQKILDLLDREEDWELYSDYRLKHKKIGMTLATGSILAGPDVCADGLSARMNSRFTWADGQHINRKADPIIYRLKRQKYQEQSQQEDEKVKKILGD